MYSHGHILTNNNEFIDKMLYTKVRKEIVKIWAEINEIENQKTTRIEHIIKTKTSFFGKKNKLDKHLTRLTKKMRKRDQINKSKIKGKKLQQTQLK